MSAPGRLIRHPENRALEDAAFAHGLAPTRIFALLLPVWRVEVKATVTDAEDYALIDRYLERGIASAGLNSAGALAGFLGLDQVVVDRALRFLAGIGHVAFAGDRVTLTDLGQRSVRDGKRYLVTRQDRRTMYFDAFGSRPLTYRYYDSRVVAFCSLGAAVRAASSGEWPKFRLLVSHTGFRREALAALAGLDERALYNLPEGIDAPESLGEECVFLPVYVVRGIARDRRVRYLAYSAAGPGSDPHLSELCEQTTEIVSVLENEELASTPESAETRVRAWLDGQGLGVHTLVRLDTGAIQVRLPAGSFGADDALRLSQVGSFVMLGDTFFHVWCADRDVRRRALLERVDTYFGSRPRLDAVEAAGWLKQVGRQLTLGDIGLAETRLMAAEAGLPGLAAQLGELIDAPTLRRG
jgi:hypothetical protein